MGARSRAVVLVALSAPLVACSLLLDLQPLAFDPADAAGLPDRASPDTAISNEAAAGDASDAGMFVDARTHCSDGKAHDFCDDFEGITGAIEDRWQKRKEVQGTGQIAAEVVAGAPSPVTVLRSTLGRGVDGGTIGHIARLSKQDSPWNRTDGGSQPGVRLAFDIYFEQLDTLNATLFTCILGAGVGAEDSLVVYAYNDGAEAVLTFLEVYFTDAGVQYGSKVIPKRIPLATWTPVEFEIQERAPGLNGGANLMIGTTAEPYSIGSSSRSPHFRLDLGLSAGSGGTDSIVLYDNVRIDYLP